MHPANRAVETLRLWSLSIFFGVLSITAYLLANVYCLSPGPGDLSIATKPIGTDCDGDYSGAREDRISAKTPIAMRDLPEGVDEVVASDVARLAWDQAAAAFLAGGRSFARR